MSRITKWKLEKTKVKVVFRLQFHATHVSYGVDRKFALLLVPVAHVFIYLLLNLYEFYKFFFGCSICLEAHVYSPTVLLSLFLVIFR